VAFKQVARNWLVLGLSLGSLGLMHCSSKDDGNEGAAGSASSSAGKGGSASVAGTSSSAGSGIATTGGMASKPEGSAGKSTSGGSGGASSGSGGGGSGGALSTPECKAEADCGLGQTCTDGKCVVKTCTPPKTEFSYTPAKPATTVSLAGSLNSWSTTASPLTLDAASGAWKGSFQLDAGTYQYKFVVDGTNWVSDPKNPDTVDDGFCGFNSQISLDCDGVLAPQGVHGSGCPPQGEGGAGGSAGEVEPGSGGSGGEHD
jgi:hypothetical protein